MAQVVVWGEKVSASCFTHRKVIQSRSSLTWRGWRCPGIQAVLHCSSLAYSGQGGTKGALQFQATWCKKQTKKQKKPVNLPHWTSIFSRRCRLATVSWNTQESLKIAFLSIFHVRGGSVLCVVTLCRFDLCEFFRFQQNSFVGFHNNFRKNLDNNSVATFILKGCMLVLVWMTGFPTGMNEESVFLSLYLDWSINK